MFEKLLSVTIIVVVLVGFHFISNLFFSKVIFGKISKRKETIIILIINILKYTALIVGIFIILSIFGVDTTSILAGAGLVGILLGFALQKLLQDMINGFFIIIENQYIVGEYVQINGKSGCVLELGLKTTKIMSYTGEMIIFSNGDITQVVNFSRNESLMIVDLVLLNENKYDKVYKIVEEVITKFSHHNIIGKINILGVEEINELSYTLRIAGKTKPYDYFEVARLLKVELVKIFQENGVVFLEYKIIHPYL